MPGNKLGTWDAILAHCPAGSLIAGGAIRDDWLDIPPKDIDVFVPVAGFEAWGAPVSWVDQGPIENQNQEYAHAINQIVAIQNFQVPLTLTPVQLIVVRDDPKVQVRRFDLNITRAYYNGKVLVYSTAFLKGMRSCCVRNMKQDASEANKDRSRERASRFIRREHERLPNGPAWLYIE